MRYLIVEDERFAYEELKRMMTKLRPGYILEKTTKTVIDTIEFLKISKVDLILMDIRLADGNCFEIFNQIEVSTPVIFTTAYVETGGGNSKHCQTLNNHFGIVGKNNVNNSKFKSFDSSKESFRSFCEMITRKKYYQKLKGNLNTSEWINSIASAGYATKPEEWKNKINLVIKKFGL